MLPKNIHQLINYLLKIIQSLRVQTSTASTTAAGKRRRRRRKGNRFFKLVSLPLFQEETNNRSNIDLGIKGSNLEFGNEIDNLKLNMVNFKPFYWWPVTRTMFTERLPKDEKLPGIDVFICTTDPKKEPTFEVMNTVISAMSLDYPAEKLSVYLSDDGGDSVTLNGIKEAWVFATWWLPFCRRYNVKTMCSRAYFEKPEEASQSWEFVEDRNTLQEKYKAFKLRIQRKSVCDEIDGDSKRSAQDHPANVQVIDEKSIEEDTATNPEHVVMPSLVYVAREKRRSHPHHFKAGALNVLV